MEDGNFIAIFKEEALEQLGTLEDTLLELETDPENEGLISAVFRVMHTIKGSAGMVGLEKISSFAHEVETLLDSVRSGEIMVTKGFIDYTLKSRDVILEMINDPDYIFEEVEEFFIQFNEAIKEPSVPVLNKKPETYRILFKVEKDIFLSGTNPLMMVYEVLSLGEGVVIPSYSAVPPLSEMDEESCYMTWEIYVTTKEPENHIRDIFIFVEGSSELSIEHWDIDVDSDEHEKLGELLIKRGIVKSDVLHTALGNQHKLGEILVKEKILTKNEVKNALKAQEFINKTKSKKVESHVAESIRVNANKLDNLVDLVGEIVTIYAQMLQHSHESRDSKQIAIIERFGLLTEELRDNAMSLRMLPIGSTFARFKRVVRDLSSELGKKINLITEGAETELDKNVIEQLHDPLVHIIRNSIDHGIEDPALRIERGKDETGTIKLSAIHAGASVHIIIEDDGGGLDRERIRNKAINNGLMEKGEEISDENLFQMIFAPGFSTAESVTTVSGRGVGMDVVKRQIEQLKGSVSIESRDGEYSRFTLILPITLAIIEGLLVKIGQEFFVIPLSSVEACVELKGEDKHETEGRNVITFREKLVPYIDIKSFFDIEGERQKIEQIVIVNSGKDQIGLLVDIVVGGNQTVIKPLGPMYKHIKEISGATILGNGSVALVFDIDKLVKTVEFIEEVTVGT